MHQEIQFGERGVKKNMLIGWGCGFFLEKPNICLVIKFIPFLLYILTNQTCCFDLILTVKSPTFRCLNFTKHNSYKPRIPVFFKHGDLTMPG